MRTTAIRRCYTGAWIVALTALSAVSAEPTDPANEPVQTSISAYEECVLNLSTSASNAISLGQIRNYCGKETQSSEGGTLSISRRSELEQFSLNNPFSLLPHRPNYLLPVTYRHYADEEVGEHGIEELRKLEVQFQLSLKAVLWDGIYKDRGRLTFGYTTRSFWRAYSIELSSPFRETNHQPEVILSLENDFEIAGARNVSNSISWNHQSNGRGGDESRSWTRLIFQTYWEKDGFALALRPWYRIPAPEERFPGDPLSDDNPDILDYMGHFDLNLVYGGYRNQYSLMLRNNLQTVNRGAIRLGWSFPLNDRVRGRLHYFEGYGESLVDYNQYNRTLGLGFELSGWF